jgi:hypothetical protein
MQSNSIGTWADTTGDHLAYADGAGGAADAAFSTWWRDRDAQTIIAALVKCDGEVGVGDPLDNAESDLRDIRQSYADELRGDEGYIDDLLHETSYADCITNDPASFLVGVAA